MRAAPLAKEYERLRVLEPHAGRDRSRQALALVECVPCRVSFRVRAKHLRIGKATSCGCKNRERVAAARAREAFRRKAAAWFRGVRRRVSMDQGFTVAEAAKRLGISDSAVRQAIYVGRLKGKRDGGTWYIDQASLFVFRVSNRGPQGKRRRPPVLEINVEGLTPEQVRELEEHAARLRAAKGAQAA
jgi:excisionase family DNA binding protein